MLWLAFAVLVAAAGWYYMFYSRAASSLGGLESDILNRQRVRLRRVGGFCMFLLGVAFFVLFQSIDRQDRPKLFFLMLLLVFILLLAIVALGLVDLRLTWKLRRKIRREDAPHEIR